MEIVLQVNKTYFDTMLPILPNICNNYSIRLPTFHLPLNKHAFAKQRLDYQLIKMLNAYGSMTFTLKAQSLYFYGFKTCVKVQLIILAMQMVVMIHLV